MAGPKYARIAAGIRDAITSGEWAPGDRLPTTTELARTWATSRATIAHALGRLGREGVITYLSDRGGWQVAGPPRRRRLSRARFSRAEAETSRGFFLTDAHQAGAPAHVETTVATIPARGRVATLLQIPDGADVVQRHRVTSIGDRTAHIAIGHVPAEIAAGTPIESEHPGPGGIVARLAELGHQITRHVESVWPARPASTAELEALGLEAGASVCQVTRVSYAGDRPVLVELIVMPPAEVELVYDLPAE